MIILSDGDSNASTKQTNFGSTKAVSSKDSTGIYSTYPSATSQCRQSMAAANAATLQKTTVYTIGYAPSTSGTCTTDTANPITACAELKAMASTPADFYAYGGSCSTGTDLSAIFGDIAYSALEGAACSQQRPLTSGSGFMAKAKAGRQSGLSLVPAPAADANAVSALPDSCAKVVGEAGLEPATPGLEGRCSVQLSYSPVAFILSTNAPAREEPRTQPHPQRQRAPAPVADARRVPTYRTPSDRL